MNTFVCVLLIALASTYAAEQKDKSTKTAQDGKPKRSLFGTDLYYVPTNAIRGVGLDTTVGGGVNLGYRSTYPIATTFRSGYPIADTFRSGYPASTFFRSGYDTTGYTIGSNLASLGDLRTHEVRTITNHVPVAVPQPYPVEVTKTVSVPQPYAVHVPKPVPVPYKVNVPVEVPKPYPVKVPEPIAVPVEVKVPVEIPKPYPVEVTRTLHVPVERPVYVSQPYKVPIEVSRPYPVHVLSQPSGFGVPQAVGVSTGPVVVDTIGPFGSGEVVSGVVSEGAALVGEPVGTAVVGVSSGGAEIIHGPGTGTILGSTILGTGNELSRTYLPSTYGASFKRL